MIYKSSHRYDKQDLRLHNQKPLNICKFHSNKLRLSAYMPTHRAKTKLHVLPSGLLHNSITFYLYIYGLIYWSRLPDYVMTVIHHLHDLARYGYFLIIQDE